MLINVLRVLASELIAHFSFSEQQDMKYDSQFNAEFFKIEATEFFLEIDAEINSKGRGFIHYTPGAGVNGSYGGSGANHATFGGTRDNRKQGTTYGSLYEPISAGSRGGVGPSGVLGARGGGVMRIIIGHSFHLDGVVNVDADNAKENSGKFSFQCPRTCARTG